MTDQPLTDDELEDIGWSLSGGCVKTLRRLLVEVYRLRAAGSATRAPHGGLVVAPIADTERLAYSPAEFAAAVGCTRQHVQNLIARGEIPSVKLGRLRRIPAHIVEDLLDEADGDAAAAR